MGGAGEVGGVGEVGEVGGVGGVGGVGEVGGEGGSIYFKIEFEKKSFGADGFDIAAVNSHGVADY